MSGNLDHGTRKMVTLNESSTYPGFHLSEEINKDLLKQIQGTEGNGSTAKVPLNQGSTYRDSTVVHFSFVKTLSKLPPTSKNFRFYWRVKILGFTGELNFFYYQEDTF